MTPSGKPASWASCADAQAGQRRLLGRLQDDRAAGRQGRAPLPGLHQQREVPGDDLPDDADRLVPGVAEVVAVDRDRLAVDLVGPAGVVAVAVDGQRQVGGLGDRDTACRCRAIRARPARRCSSRSGRRACCSSRPRSAAFIFGQGPSLERLAGGLDGQVDVGLVALGDLAMSSPVAGLMVANVLPDELLTHSLLIRSFVALTRTRLSIAAGAVAIERPSFRDVIRTVSLIIPRSASRSLGSPYRCHGFMRPRRGRKRQPFLQLPSTPPPAQKWIFAANSKSRGLPALVIVPNAAEPKLPLGSLSGGVFVS